MDLTPGNIYLDMSTDLRRTLGQKEFKSLNTPSLEATALDSLTLAEFHEVCYWQFSRFQSASICNLNNTVNVGAVISCSSGNGLEDLVEIVFLLRIKSNLGVPCWNTAPCAEGDTMEDGWTRYDSSAHRGQL
jgi:hypothetical protein